MDTIITKIRTRLWELQDEKYRDFQAKLIPTIPKDSIIGVRIPVLRKLAKQLWKEQDVAEFLNDLPHRYYEENNLHIFIIGLMTDYVQSLSEVERFLPYIDNWSTCDAGVPKAFTKHTEELLFSVQKWISLEQPYTIRYGVGMLMRCYLGENFKPVYAEWVAGIQSEEYYVKMMVAWYFATALAKNYEQVLPFVEEKRLDDWTHNKTIQKARESFRITASQKEYLNSLKVKK